MLVCTYYIISRIYLSRRMCFWLPDDCFMELFAYLFIVRLPVHCIGFCFPCINPKRNKKELHCCGYASRTKKIRRSEITRHRHELPAGGLESPVARTEHKSDGSPLAIATIIVKLTTKQRHGLLQPQAPKSKWWAIEILTYCDEENNRACVD